MELQGGSVTGLFYPPLETMAMTEEEPRAGRGRELTSVMLTQR